MARDSTEKRVLTVLLLLSLCIIVVILLSNVLEFFGGSTALGGVARFNLVIDTELDFSDFLLSCLLSSSSSRSTSISSLISPLLVLSLQN